MTRPWPLAISLIALGCGNGDGMRGSAPAQSVEPAHSAAEVAAPTSTPEDRCPFEGDVGCLDSATVLTCGAQRTFAERACGSETCLGGRCGPPPAAIARARLRAVSPEGWFNAWSAQIGIGPKLTGEIVASGSLGKMSEGAGAKPLCAADGWVNPRRAIPGEEKSQSAAILSGTLVRDRAGSVEIRAGVSGKLTLKIGSQTLVALELLNREGRALPDERFFEIDVPAGATPIIAVLEPETGGFYLRMRDKQGRTPNGLAFAEQFQNASCKTSALLDHDATVTLSTDGFHASAAPRFRGLVPLLPPDFALGLVVAGSGKTSSERSLSFARSTLIAEAPARTDALIELPTKGASELRFALGDETLLSRKLPDDGGLAARASKLLSTVEETREKTALPSGSRASLEHHATTIAKALAAGDNDRAWLRRKIEDAEPIAEAFLKGEDAYAKKRGVVFRAYRSPLDGRLQPYVAYIPRSIDTGKPVPVVLVAHGRDRLPEHALRTLIGQAPDQHMSLSFAARNLPGFPDQGAILVAPWGYGNAGVLPVGERDLSDVIDELKRAYNIDERRVSLTGYSLGGTVSFVAPLHRPDKFAAAAPLCGYPNLLDYASVSKVPHLPYEEAMLEKEYIVRYAENGAYVPLHIVHGGLDVPGRSKVVADRYKALRYSHVFDIQEDLDHNVWDYAYEDGKMVPWLTRHKVPELPKAIHFSTGKLRYDRAYWLRVLELGDSGKRARIDATLTATGVDMTTQNVAALRIDADKLGLPTGEVSVTIDGALSKADTKGSVTLRRGSDGTFAIATEELIGKKVHGSSGPLDDVQNGAVTVVYGTLDRPNREANRLVAAELATLGGSADIRYPVLADVDATDEALAGRNVVLVGGPNSNKLTASIAGMLPVQLDADAVVLRGKRHVGKDVAVSLVFPGPEAFFGDGAKKRSLSRYVVLHAGVTPRATLAARMLPRYLPDFVVYDGASFGERGGLLMNTRAVLAAGFFSEEWQ